MACGESREKSESGRLLALSSCKDKDSSMPTYCNPFCRKEMSAPGGMLFSAERMELRPSMLSEAKVKAECTNPVVRTKGRKDCQEAGGAQTTRTHTKTHNAVSRRYTTRRRVEHLPDSRRYRCIKKLISSEVIVMDGGALASEDDSWSSSDALFLALPLDIASKS